MNQTLRILVIGVSTLDLFLREVEFPKPDDHAYLSDYKLSPGGSAVNLAFCLRQLGVQTSLFTRLGNDAAGEFVSKFLEASHIRLLDKRQNLTLQTGIGIVNVARDGRIALLHFEGANNALSTDDLPECEIERHDIIHVAGALSLGALDGVPLAKLMKEARSMLKITSLHTSRNTDNKKQLYDTLPYLDYIFMNQKEAEHISGKINVEDASKWFHNQGVTTVAVTLGSFGAHVSNSKFSGTIPAMTVPVMDTTGCGDAFTAGFLDAAWRHEHIRDCGALGIALAAHCAQTLGALPRPFNRADLLS